MEARGGDTRDVAALGRVAESPTVERAVIAAREFLDMDVAYATRITETDQVFEVLRGDGNSFGLHEGLEMPLDQTYCQRIIAEQLPSLIGDVKTHPEAGAMPVTEAAEVGAFASVPLTFSDGRFYGTLCCASHSARPTLGERDLGFLRVFARLISAELERGELEQDAARLKLRASSAEALARAVEARDSNTGDHSRAVVELAMRVGAEVGLGTDELQELELVALLHDIGKLSVPDAILAKPGPLTEAEWEVMRCHPVDGERLAASVEQLEALAPAIRSEHERWDGKGYPDGLAGEAIPVASRIAFVCDAFHAMTSDRPYRAALTRDEAIAEIEANAGAQFCPQAASALLAIVRQPDV